MFGDLSQFEIVGISIGIITGIIFILQFFLGLSEKSELTKEGLTEIQINALLKYYQMRNNKIQNLYRYIYCLFILFIFYVLPKIYK